jgi:hypothetical protein
LDHLLVIYITDVKCPVCRERLSGRDVDELNNILSKHLADVHHISRTITGGMWTAPLPYPETERQVTTWSGVEPSQLPPEAQRQREAVTKFDQPGVLPTEAERKATAWNDQERMTNEEQRRALEASEQWKDPRSGKTEAEREVTTWSKGTSEEPAGSSYPTGPYGRGPAGAGIEKTFMASATHGGGTLHRLLNRNEMKMMLECPMCSRPVYGSDEEDLSDELRFHFRDEHHIKRR